MRLDQIKNNTNMSYTRTYQSETVDDHSVASLLHKELSEAFSNLAAAAAVTWDNIDV